MADALTIRRFANTDAAAARDLFIRVNRLLAPPQMKEAFETYIASAIAEEIGRIAEYYAARRGSFWVAEDSGRLAGMIWVQPSAHPVTEKPDWLVINVAVAEPFQRHGIGKRLMDHAQREARAAGARRMRLFVAAENTAAVTLYHALGYTEQTREMLLKF